METATFSAPVITSVPFGPRGIGLNSLPCFLCPGSEPTMQSDCACFVPSRAEAYQVAEWFRLATGWLELGDAVMVDFRFSEDRWIQVKVGACKDHESKLNLLMEAVAKADYQLTEEMLERVLGPHQRVCACKVEGTHRTENHACPTHSSCVRKWHDIHLTLPIKGREQRCGCGRGKVEVFVGRYGDRLNLRTSASDGGTVVVWVPSEANGLAEQLDKATDLVCMLATHCTDPDVTHAAKQFMRERGHEV